MSNSSIRVTWNWKHLLQLSFHFHVIFEQNFSASEKLTYFSPMSHFYTPWKLQKTHGLKAKMRPNPVDYYMFKVNNRDTRTRCEICSKLTIKIPERHQWHRSSILIVNFEHVSHLALFFVVVNFEQVNAACNRHNNRLHHLTTSLCIWRRNYQNLFQKIATEENTWEKSNLVFYNLYNIRADTVFDSGCKTSSKTEEKYIAIESYVWKLL